MADQALPLHAENSVQVDASAAALFAYLDDHRNLSAHMSKSSWMMVGSSMSLDLDEADGRATGSRISLRGRVLGLPLSVDEVVTVRAPPARKTWQTVGRPKLVVIGPYRMGFEITPDGDKAALRVFIDYALPEPPASTWPGRMFGGAYARWCTSRMTSDAAAHFADGR
jgi:hypothetical protein